MPPLDIPDRRMLFARMMEEAAASTGLPAPRLPAMEVFAQTSVADRLQDPLTLMMAALMALQVDVISALSLNRTELAWKVARTLVADRMREAVGHHKALFLHMAGVATLCGTLSREEALHILEEESMATGLGSVADPETFISALQAWLPGEATEIGAIQPDIVGEAFLIGDGNTRYLYNAETAVLRAARRKIGPVIQTLVRTAQDFSFSVAGSRQEPLAWLERLIEQGQADEDLELLMELSNRMPKSSLVLRDAAVRISQALLARLRAADQDSVAMQMMLGVALNTLANRLSEAGQREKALLTAQEAAELYRELVSRNRDAFLPDLAMSLNNLANQLSAAGQRKEALLTAQEAAGLYHELVPKSPDTFVVSYARALGTLGQMLVAVDHLSEAAVVFAAGLEAILPWAEKFPQALSGLGLALLKKYVSLLQTAGLKPDTGLLEKAASILGPYLNQGD